MNSAYEDALQDSGDSYWAKKQYRLIVNTLHRKKAGTVNAFDRSLEWIVAYFSTITFPYHLFQSLLAAASSAPIANPQLTIDDLDVDEEDGNGGADSALKRKSSLRSRRTTPSSRRSMTNRIESVSTAPDWMHAIPLACKHTNNGKDANEMSSSSLHTHAAGSASSSSSSSSSDLKRSNSLHPMRVAINEEMKEKQHHPPYVSYQNGDSN